MAWKPALKCFDKIVHLRCRKVSSLDILVIMIALLMSAVDVDG
jgi:hypothetical protein